ncbi:uncharacterized protein ISCGN_025293 [Ixodes scapularis]
MSSRGASATAFTGRGSSTEMSQDSYRVVLPSLPTGTEVLNSVFAHCDTSGRPYKIEDFRTQMERHGVLQDLIGAGQYQMNHVWLFAFNSLTAKRKLLAAKELVVKEKRCLLIDPDECEVRLRLHWTPIHISDDAVRRALEPYGKVNEVSRDTWRVEGFQNVQTTTRFVKMNLKEGTTKDHLPHQLVMFGSKVLVVVPGRAPLCLRCKRTGHIRRECRVPHCDKCNRYGHEQEDCIRTYATVMLPAPGEDNSEFFIDEEEAEKGEDDIRHPVTTGDPKVTDGRQEHLERKNDTTLSSCPTGREGDSAREDDTLASNCQAGREIDLSRKNDTISSGPLAGREGDLARESDTILPSCLGADNPAVGNASPGVDGAASDPSKDQSTRPACMSDHHSDITSEDDLEMDEGADPSKRPLDLVEEGPDWTPVHGRKKRCKPRPPPGNGRERTS